MECFCGCRRAVPRKLEPLNIRLGEIAWEMLAWRKSLIAADPVSPDALRTERRIERGAGCYQDLLASVHGEREIISLHDSDEWLEESRSSWRNRSEMTEKGGLLHGPELRLTDDDVAKLDRGRPERSFLEPRPTDPEPAAASDVVDQLERLGAMRANGVLTEEEFNAVKAGILRRHTQAPGA